MDEIKLQKFKEIVDILDKDVPSATEVAELVATIIQVVKEAKEFLKKQAIENKKDLNDFVNRLTEQEVQKIAEALDNLEKKANKVISDLKEKTKLDLDVITKNLYLELKKLADSIPKEADFTEIYVKIKEVEGKIPSLPEEIKAEQVRDKLETLEGDERLDKKYIKGLDEELTAIRNLPRGGGGAPRRVFQPYRDDFSSLTDGSTKTFYLTRAPLDEATVMVFGTDFPTILRPTIDFTIANKALTLTSAVPAPNTGATLLVTYFS